MTTPQTHSSALAPAPKSKLLVPRARPKKRRARRLLYLALVLALAAGGSCFVLLKRSHNGSEAAITATVHVTTVPPGAEVQLDGHDRGRTPAALAVSEGRHRFGLHLAGYAPVALDERITAGQIVDLQRDLWLSTPAVQPSRVCHPPVTPDRDQFDRDSEKSSLSRCCDRVVAL